MGEMRNVYKILVERPEWERKLGRLMHRQADNIETYLKEI
jgi:hypothetical protein